MGKSDSSHWWVSVQMMALNILDGEELCHDNWLKQVVLDRLEQDLAF